MAGFAVRLTPNLKSFVLDRRINGRMRRITLGRYGDLTVDQARNLAQQMGGAIARGEDPAQVKIDKKKEATFGCLEEQYLERHAIHKKSAYNDRLCLNRYLAPWRARKLSAITRNDVARLHTKIGTLGHPYSANRMIALVRKMFNLALDWGLFKGENPATRIPMFKEQARDRFVQPEELPRLFKALSEEPNDYIRTAFLTTLLTGARRGEVLGMRWIDVRLEQLIWRLPDTKAGKPHLLPLPSPLMALLLNLDRVEGNPFVFVGRDGKSHLVNIRMAWKRIRGRAGIEDVRIHDLRRTLGSWLAVNGTSLHIIGKALNHTNVSTTAIYARLNLEPVRTVLEENAKNMIAVGGTLPINP
jgi:integrase